jgi:hypothetical protein
MGLLKIFSKSTSIAPKLDRLPVGSLTIDRCGGIVGTTLSSTISKSILVEIGRTVQKAFASAEDAHVPLSELVSQFSGIRMVARELHGGAIIFLLPEAYHPARITLPPMSNPNLEQFVLYLETYVECWKQFNYYVNLARTKKFTPEDETQFLEVKSLITQGLEVILAAVEQGGPRKDEVMALINAAPSIRHLAEHENVISTVESQWHKAFLTMQSLLGRLKVQQQKQGGEWNWGSLFGRGER